jgi:hypothetical protein
MPEPTNQPQEEFRDDRGPVIAICGTLASGIKEVYGPFATVHEAVEWAVARLPLIGSVHVVLLEPPETCNVQPLDKEADKE